MIHVEMAKSVDHSSREGIKSIFIHIEIEKVQYMHLEGKKIIHPKEYCHSPREVIDLRPFT